MAALAIYVWTRRSVSGAYSLAATLASIAHLLLTNSIEVQSVSLSEHMFWQHVQIPGYAAMPVCCLILALCYVKRPVRGWPAAALFLIPAAGVLVHWTDGWHHLYWSRVWIDRSAPAPVMARTYGWAFWVFVSYSYLMTASSVVLLTGYAAHNRAQRTRTLVFLASVLLPCASSLLYVFDWFPIRHFDITPYTLTFTGMGTLWTIFRHRFQGIVPVAAQSVVNSMAEGIVVLDLDGRVAELNPMAQTMLNRRKEGLVGQPAAAAMRDLADLTPFCDGEGAMSGDIQLPAGNGLRLCAASAVDVMQGTHRIGRVITLRDVMAERQASEQLREARQAAEAAAIAKSRFLANMSHEIRTPMNGVLGATELLLGSGLNDEQRDLAQTTQESAQVLLSLLNDILDFSKIDAGKLELERVPFDLHHLAGQIVRLMRPTAVRQGLKFNLSVAPDAPRAIMGDPTRMRQILLNLVGNAIKFTAAGSVTVSVGRAPAGPGQTRVVMRVKDTGIGIASDRIDTLFEEFSQADSSVTRNFGGTGLGLAISQRLVGKMGGRIRVESTPGQGSEFIVEIPVDLADARDIVDPQPATLAGGEACRACRVLLAEDNTVNQKIGKRILEKLGCQVEIANNGREAIAMARAAAHDVILMDIQMPEIGGIEAARAIRSLGIRIPIVALTADVFNETRDACEAAGMDAFVGKPFHLNEIASVLKRVRT